MWTTKAPKNQHGADADPGRETCQYVPVLDVLGTKRDAIKPTDADDASNRETDNAVSQKRQGDRQNNPENARPAVS